MRTTLRLPLLVVAACAAAMLAACGGDQTGGGAGAATDPTYATNPDTPMDQKPTTPPADGGNTGGDNGGGNSGDNGGGNTNEQTGPTIVSFRVASKPSCPAGTNVNPIPGQPVKLSWKVSGTDKVTISIDGPGVFSEYPAEHSETFSFGCDGNPGDTAKHTFLLRTVGGGDVAEKTLTVSAKVNEITVVTDEQATRTETELPSEETGTESE